MVKLSAKKSRRTTNPTSQDDTQKEYQVEAILDKRIRGKKTQYLLKWKGYSSKHNSWEDAYRLNCPDLFRRFETNWKRNSEKRNSKDSSCQEIDEDQETDNDYEYDDNQSMTSENENNQIKKRQSLRKKLRLSNLNNNESSSVERRHSTRKIINQTKSRITSMSKNDSSTDDDNDDIYQQISSTRKSSRTNRKLSNATTTSTVDDGNENINRVSSQSRKNQPKKSNNKNNPRLRIAPSSTSSISCTYNHRNFHNEIIDETDQIERIENVRNDRDEILFRIKFVNENQPQWVSSKIANRKYPQAVISFWESHVEFS